MFRPAVRSSLRRSSQAFVRAGQRHERRNIVFTPPAKRPRSWKGTIARWGLAGGGLYWYSTSDMNLFDAAANEHGQIGHAILEVSDEAQLPTLEEIAAARRDRQLATLTTSPSSSDVASTTQSNSLARTSERTPSATAPSDESSSVSTMVVDGPGVSAGGDSPGALEDEAESQGAFNEETGEINWDCPCLGGMAHGPCGEQFRNAFSCFVYSKEEPKGVDCIDKFKTMQNCFREHPDIYGAELTDDDEPEEGAATPLDTTAPAPAPYSGASTPADSVPPNNLTASPSTSAMDVAGGSPPGAAAKAGTAVSDLKPGTGSRDEAKATKNRAVSQQVKDEHSDPAANSESVLVPRAAVNTKTE